MEPREILSSIKKKNPAADKEALIVLFREHLLSRERGARAALHSVIGFYVNHVYDSLFSASRAAGLAARRENRKRADAEAQAFIRRAHRIMLLDLVLPTGKRLRNSTKEEVEATGGWYAELGAKLKPGETVGRAWKEDQVRHVFDSWANPARRAA